MRQSRLDAEGEIDGAVVDVDQRITAVLKHLDLDRVVELVQESVESRACWAKRSSR